MKPAFASIVIAVAFLFLSACSNSGHDGASQPSMMMDMPMPMTMPMPARPVIKDAIAVLHPLGDSKVMGIVRFTQTDAGVAVVADVEGLTPGKHGFHIHEWGDCSDLKAGMSAGGHYNPEHMQHGLPTSAEHHPGDMGNLDANADGKAHLELTLPHVTIDGDHDPILGRSVIVHEKEDDGSQPTGNAGGRVACAVIGVAKPK